MTMNLSYDDYLEHYGVKGMKWGVRRSDEQLSAAKSARKTERKKATEDAKDYLSSNKKKTVGSAVAATLLIGPAGTSAAVGAQIARSAGYSKGKSIGIGLLGGAPGGIIAAEVQVRKRAKESVSD